MYIYVYLSIYMCVFFAADYFRAVVVHCTRAVNTQTHQGTENTKCTENKHPREKKIRFRPEPEKTLF